MVNITFVSSNYGPLWRPAVESWLRCLVATDRYLHERGLGKIDGLGITDRMYVHSADNALVRDLLQNPDSTHLMHVESDMILPDRAIIDLLEVDKPIVSGLYFLRQGNGQPCLYKKVFRPANTRSLDDYTMSPVRLFPTEKPFRLNGCPGLGCVLLRRDVFEQLEPPWFDLKEQAYGSDLYFYTKVRRAGIEVWVHPQVRCAQVEYQVWTFDDYARAQAEDPQWLSHGVIIGTEEAP